jgi:hypothetical protein
VSETLGSDPQGSVLESFSQCPSTTSFLSRISMIISQLKAPNYSIHVSAGLLLVSTSYHLIAY